MTLVLLLKVGCIIALPNLASLAPCVDHERFAQSDNECTLLRHYKFYMMPCDASMFPSPGAYEPRASPGPASVDVERRGTAVRPATVPWV
jgi:hypothetical protein